MQDKKIIIENISSQEFLDQLIKEYRAMNPKGISWLTQADGKFRLEVELSGVAVNESQADGRSLICE